MNKRIDKLLAQSGLQPYYAAQEEHIEKFIKLLVKDVLKEVETRAYYCGDRAWSDETDRPWIELEYGFGWLADQKRGK